MRAHKPKPVDAPKNGVKAPEGYDMQWYATHTGGMRVELVKRQRREELAAQREVEALQQLPLPLKFEDSP